MPRSDVAMNRLEQAVLSRAINGVARPVFYKGEQVGEWRHHDERLAMFLLRYRRSNRFGPWRDRMPAPIEDGRLWDRDESVDRLDWHCGEIDAVDDPDELPGEAEIGDAPRA